MAETARRAALGAFCVLLLGAPAARAHDIDPLTVYLCGAGQEGTVRVSDAFGCAADISVRSADAAVVTVLEPSMARAVDQTFRVRSVAVGTTRLDIQWAGVGAGCDDVGGEVVGVVVRSVTAPECSPMSSANEPRAGTVGDPVSTSTGEHYGAVVDLVSGGPLPLVLARWHGSMLTRRATPGPLGDGWQHVFEERLEVGSTRVLLWSWRGRRVEFAPASGSFAQRDALDEPLLLTTSGGEYRVLDVSSGASRVFSAAGQLSRLEDGRGSVVTLTYTLGRLSSVSDGLGRRFDLAYEPTSGRLSSVSFGAFVVRYGYTAGRLTSVTDPAGGVTQYAYDAAGRLSAETAPSGARVTSQVYDAAERVTNQLDAAGGTWMLSYAPPLTTITDPLGNVEQHEHTSGRLVRWVDGLGAAVALEHDAAGRRTAIVDRLGARTTFAYDAASGQLASRTDAAGAVTSFAYTARGGAWDLTRVTLPDASSVSFERDATGAVVALVDAEGQRWETTRNTRGQVLARTDPAGGRVTVSYDAAGRPATVTDAAGAATTYTYDEADRPVRASFADGTARALAWDPRGPLVSVTDEAMRTTRFGYDANGRLATVTDRAGASSTLERDAAGRVARVVGRDGAAVALERDLLGRVTRVTDAHGVTVSYARDAAGRLASLTDAAGGLWTVTTDAEGVPTSVRDPAGGTWSVTSDALGRPTRRTDPLGASVTLERDLLGRVTRVTDALGVASTRSYDRRGRVVGASAGDGLSTVRFERDARGLAVAYVDPRGNRWTHGYDAAGRLVRAANPLGQESTVERDPRGRVTRVTYPDGAGTLSIERSPTGRPAALRYSDGTTIVGGYDAEDRLVSASGLVLRRDAAGRVVESNGVLIARGAHGRVTSRTLAPGRAVAYTYDAAGRLATVTDWLGGTTRFAYDALGRVSRIERTNGVVTTYERDAAGRPTRIADGTVASHTLVRDLAGRVTSATRVVPTVPSFESGTRTFSYDAANRLEGRDYDPLGRLVRDGDLVLERDLAGRARRVTRAATTVDYEHDARGRVVARTTGGVRRERVWDDSVPGGALAVEREGGADRRYVVYTPGGLPLYLVDASTGARRHLHYDETGSTRVVTADDGTVESAFAYSPAGELLVGPTGGTTPPADELPLLFHGALGWVYDWGTGLYEVPADRFRRDLYDPGTLRLTSGGSKATSALATETWAADGYFQNAFRLGVPEAAGKLGPVTGDLFIGEGTIFQARMAEHASEISIDSSFWSGGREGVAPSAQAQPEDSADEGDSNLDELTSDVGGASGAASPPASEPTTGGGDLGDATLWSIRLMFDELLDADYVEETPIDVDARPGTLALTDPIPLTCDSTDVGYDGYYIPNGNRVTFPVGPCLYLPPDGSSAAPGTALPPAPSGAAGPAPDSVLGEIQEVLVILGAGR